MREMKDSGVAWIGKIPSNWEIIANKHLMKKIKNIRSKYAGENVLSLTMRGVIVRDLDNPTGKMPATFDGYQFVEAGNLLMCLFDIDVTPRCIGLIKNDGVCSPAYSQFKLSEIADSAYYYYYYLNLDYTKELLHLAKNLRHSLTEEQLGAVPTVLPPIAEQYKIVEFLDAKMIQVDTLIANVQTQVEKLKAYKQSLITEVVTKGLDPNVLMKDSGVEWIGEIPAHWDVVKTGRLFKENNRKPYGNDSPLSLSQVDGLIATDDMKESSLKTSTYDNWKRVELGDLVLNRFKAHLGVLFAATLTGIVSFHYGVYEARRTLVPKFYEYLYHADQYRAILGNASNGMVVGLQNLSNLNFYSTYSLYPAYEEQKEIVAYLDRKCSQIDRLISIKQAKIEKLEQYKRSLVYEYVTGKKTV